MEKYVTPMTMIRAAGDMNRIAEALRVPNDACLLMNFPNVDPNPPYRVEKAHLAVQQAEKLAINLEEDPQRFNLDPIAAALTITLLKRATEELRDATDTWKSFLDSMPDLPDSWT